MRPGDERSMSVTNTVIGRRLPSGEKAIAPSGPRHEAVMTGWRVSIGTTVRTVLSSIAPSHRFVPGKVEAGDVDAVRRPDDAASATRHGRRRPTEGGVGGTASATRSSSVRTMSAC